MASHGADNQIELAFVTSVMKVASQLLLVGLGLPEDPLQPARKKNRVNLHVSKELLQVLMVKNLILGAVT